MHIQGRLCYPLALSCAILTAEQMIKRRILTITTISPFVKAALFRKLIFGCEDVFSDRVDQRAALEGSISGTRTLHTFSNII